MSIILHPSTPLSYVFMNADKFDLVLLCFAAALVSAECWCGGEGAVGALKCFKGFSWILVNPTVNEMGLHYGCQQWNFTCSNDRVNPITWSLLHFYYIHTILCNAQIRKIKIIQWVIDPLCLLKFFII